MTLAPLTPPPGHPPLGIAVWQGNLFEGELRLPDPAAGEGEQVAEEGPGEPVEGAMAFPGPVVEEEDAAGADEGDGLVDGGHQRRAGAGVELAGGGLLPQPFDHLALVGPPVNRPGIHSPG